MVVRLLTATLLALLPATAACELLVNPDPTLVPGFYGDAGAAPATGDSGADAPVDASASDARPDAPDGSAKKTGSADGSTSPDARSADAAGGSSG